MSRGWRSGPLGRAARTAITCKTPAPAWRQPASGDGARPRAAGQRLNLPRPAPCPRHGLPAGKSVEGLAVRTFRPGRQNRYSQRVKLAQKPAPGPALAASPRWVSGAQATLKSASPGALPQTGTTCGYKCRGAGGPDLLAGPPEPLRQLWREIYDSVYAREQPPVHFYERCIIFVSSMPSDYIRNNINKLYYVA